jgi:hypothetical protein
MEYRTDWKQFLQFEPTPSNGNRRRRRTFPMYLVDTGPDEKQCMYHDEYTAMIAAEQTVKDAQRASREIELAASRPDELANGNSTAASELPVPPGSLTCQPRLPAVLGRDRPPDLERHSRRCMVCSHPDRDAIEGEFIRWRSPHKIARDYAIADRNSIYRHAHATNLFEERRNQIGRVLESYLETIDDCPPADFDPVTRAVRVYAHLNANGAWVEPPRTLRILTSREPWPDPHGPEDLDEPPENELHGEPISRPSDEFSQVPVGTAEGSPGRQSWERERPEPLTSGPELRDRPSRASLDHSVDADQ